MNYRYALTRQSKIGGLGHRHNLWSHHWWSHRAENDLAMDLLHQFSILCLRTSRCSPSRPSESSSDIALPEIPICRLDRRYALHRQCNSITVRHHMGRRAVRMGLVSNASSNSPRRSWDSGNIGVRMARHVTPLHPPRYLRVSVSSRGVRLCYRARSDRKYAPIPPSHLNSYIKKNIILQLTLSLSSTIQLYGDLYYIPFYLETVKAFSPVMTGVGLMPITVGIIPTSLIIGNLVSRFGRFRWAVWLGWAVTILGTGLLIALDVEIKTWQWILCLLVLGLGHGMILSTLTYTIQVVSSDEDGPYALAMYTSIRTFGMCVGVAVGGTAFQNLLARYLRESRLDEAIARDAEQYVKVLLAMPKTNEFRQMVVRLYAKAFRGVFEVFTGISGLGGIAGLVIRSYSMNRALKTEHGLAFGKR